MGYGRWLSAILTGMLWVGGAQAAEVLRAAYEDEAQPPYFIGSSSSFDPDRPGVSIELVKAAAKAVGMEVEFIRMPWVRCLKSLQKGEVDAVFNSSFREDRMEFGVYPMAAGKPDAERRIATLTYSLYRVKGSPVNWNGKAIDGLDGPVGVQSGYSIIGDLTRMGVKIEEAQASVTNFKKLASKRIPAVVTLESNGDGVLATGEFPNVEKVTPPLVTKDYFVMFSHQFYDGKRPLAEALWTKIAEVRERDGAKLYAKYSK